MTNPTETQPQPKPELTKSFFGLVAAILGINLLASSSDLPVKILGVASTVIGVYTITQEFSK